MVHIKTIDNYCRGNVAIATLDRIYEIDGRCLGKVSENGVTTIYSGVRREDVIRFYRKIVIED